MAKGYMWSRKNRYVAAKDAVRHALANAYRDRRRKKRDFRRLWNVQINAAAREAGLNYSRLMAGLKNAKIELDRKMLADLARHNPEVFKELAAKVK